MRFVVSGSRSRHLVAGSLSLAAAGFALAACSDALSRTGTREASVSFGVVQNGALLTASSAGLADIVISDDDNSVDLTSADVVFGRIKFKGVEAPPLDESDDSDSDSDGHRGDAVFHAGAATVSLPLEGGSITPFTGTLPVGTYRWVQLHADFVRLIGTYNGEAFDVTVPINGKMRLRFDPPIDLTETSEPIAVSVNIDVASWFRDSEGRTIDPRLLATNAEMRAHFRNRVRASFRAFEDEDRDHDESDSDSDSDRSGSNSGQG